MADTKKLDTYFYEKDLTAASEKKRKDKREQVIRMVKLVLPAVAALLISMLLIIPHLRQQAYDITLDITKPKKGELEKLHMEQTTFFITDKKNQVSNFTASAIDETAPGSKLVKLQNPEGIIPSSPTTWTDIKAPTGFYNQTENILTLTDNVEMFYSEGMSLKTFEGRFDFKKGMGEGKHHVSGQGVFGDIEASGFIVDNNKNILTFTGPADITLREESFKQGKNHE